METKITKRGLGLQQSSIRAVTRRIEAVNGINLGQGTCPLIPNPLVRRAAISAIDNGSNSYTLYDGIPELRQAVAERVNQYNCLDVTPENILITAGATGGIECICKCLLEPGDEVVLFSPLYQYHIYPVLEYGATPVFVQLHPPDWRIQRNALEAAITERTKFILFSNPNNPTGRVFSREELTVIGDVCRERNILAVVDEVYEYILGPQAQHISLASFPGMSDYTLTVSSASKTFFVTGWRIGWVISKDKEVIRVVGIKSDRTYVCAPAPLQHGVTVGLRLEDEFFDEIRDSFNWRRDMLCAALSEAGFRPLVPEGAYYVLADYTSLGWPDDIAASNALIDLAGIGSIPGGSFFANQPRTGLLRFCFALPNDQIARACDMLTRRSL